MGKSRIRPEAGPLTGGACPQSAPERSGRVGAWGPPVLHLGPTTDRQAPDAASSVALYRLVTLPLFFAVDDPNGRGLLEVSVLDDRVFPVS